MIRIKYKPNAFEEVFIEYSTDKVDHLIPILKEMKKFYDVEHPNMFSEKVCILINNEVWEVDSWNYCMLEEGDLVEIVPEVLGGGGTGSKIFGAIMIVVGVALIVTGYNPPAGWKLTEVGASMMVMVGVSLAMSGLMTLIYKAPKPVGFGGGDTTSDSPTYSWDGVSMTQLSNIPIPVVYGEHSVGGNLISFYTTNDGVETFLHMLIALSEGEIEGIMKADGTGVCNSINDTPYVKINDQDYSIYTRGESYIEWDYRLGTNTQTIVPGFRNIHTYYTDGREITNSFIQYETTSDLVNGLEVFINAPALFKLTNSGDLESVGVDIEVDISSNGGSSWASPVGRATVLSASSLLSSTVNDSYTWNALLDSGPHAISSTDTVVTINLYVYHTNATQSWTNDPTKRTTLRVYGGPNGNILKYEGFPPMVNGAPKTLVIEYITSYTSERIYVEGRAGVRSIGNPDYDSVTNLFMPINITTRSIVMGGIRISGKTKSKVNKTISLRNLASDSYFVRVRRLNPPSTDIRITDNVYLTGIDEITYNNLTYPNTALLFLKIKASSVISGGVPNVVTRIRGVKIAVPKLTIGAVTQAYNRCYWDASDYKRASDDVVCVDSGLTATQWTQNPVYCTKDIKINKRYGLGHYLTSNDIDNTYLNTAGKHAWEYVSENVPTSEHRFHLDINIDNEMGAWETIAMLAKTFRGWAIWSEGKIKLLCDKEDTPVQLFTMGNINKDSVTEQFSSISQIPNVIECQFANADRDYVVDVREVVYEPDWTSGKPKRIHKEDFRGITRESQLVREGTFFINCARYRTKAIGFAAGMDSVHCVAGDLFYFQHETPEWGYGGRIKEVVSASAIITDIDFVATTNDILMCRLQDGTIEQYSAVASPLIHKITTATVFTTTPEREGIWAYGKRSVDIQTYRILSIDRKNNDEVTISALEYNASVYNDSHVLVSSPLYTGEIVDLAKPAPPVQDFTLSEKENGSGIYVSFSPPTTSVIASVPTPITNYSHAEIWVSTDGGGKYHFMGNDYGIGDTTLTVSPGVTYTVKVYSINKSNVKNEASPVFGMITPTHVRPLAPTGLRLDQLSNYSEVWEGKDAKFTWRRPSSISGAGVYGVGWEPGGFGQWQAVDYDMSYRIEVWKDNTPKRHEIVRDNRYVYSYEKNVHDFVIPSGSFELRVYGWNDRANLKSDDYAEISVSNLAPSAVSSLTSESIEDGVSFSWAKTEGDDFSHYYYRYSVAISGGGYGDYRDWQESLANTIDLFLSSTELAGQSSQNSSIRIQVKAVDVYSNESPIAETTGTAYNFRPELVVSPSGGTGVFTSVNEAVNNVPAGGCTIILKEGVHQINSKIILPAYDTDIIGSGKGSTIIETVTNDDTFYGSSTAVGAYKFSNFSVKSRTSDPTNNYSIIKFNCGDNTSNIDISNIKFVLVDNAATLYSSEPQAGDIAIKVESNTGAVSIANCSASGGLAFARCGYNSNVAVVGNKVENSLKWGIDLYGDVVSGLPNYVEVTSNKINNVGYKYYGMRVSGNISRGLIADNNILINNVEIASAYGLINGLSVDGFRVSIKRNNVDINSNRGNTDIYGISTFYEMSNSHMSDNVVYINNRSASSNLIAGVYVYSQEIM